MKNLVFGSLIALGLVGFVGCTNSSDASVHAKCSSSKCSANSKCGADKVKKTASKCGEGKCGK